MEVFLSNVKVNGRDVRANQLVRKKGGVIGVRLGDIGANTSVRIDSSYELSKSLSIFEGQEPALRVEIFKAPSSKDLKA